MFFIVSPRFSLSTTPHVQQKYEKKCGARVCAGVERLITYKTFFWPLDGHRAKVGNPKKNIRKHEGVLDPPTPIAVWPRDSHYRSQLKGGGTQVTDFITGFT